MSEAKVATDSASEELRRFMRALLQDVRALEQIIERGDIESGVRRIGAEQEMFLVDDALRPAPLSPEVLGRLDGNFTEELARFNLEANLSPQVLEGSCLADMESELRKMVAQADAAARDVGARVLLAGILPTLVQDDLTLDNMMPSGRYRTLNRVMTELRGGRFETRIKGLDELSVSHDNVMLESCNTSFQVHFQVGADEFAKLYNLAQAVTGPVLAAAVNSPVFLGHRLWHETRVALFQQSLDARSKAHQERGRKQRVTFGDAWIENSVLEIFREDIARFRVLLASDLGESSLSILERGEMPALKALCLHNGTVYRWNRPCYGVKDGKAHLRIENRVLPAGPTIEDELANAAFFFGVMVGLDRSCDDITTVMEFNDAKANFTAGARYGLDAQFRWLGGRTTTARDLILDQLLPLARAGLVEKSITPADIDRYLGIIEERVRSGRTGSQWALDSLARLGNSGTQDERQLALTAAIAARQAEGRPVHTWALVEAKEDIDWRHSFRKVSQVMTSDVFTLHPEDVIDLAASLMDWEHLRRVPVEDDAGRLVGLLSQRGLMRLVARGGGPGGEPLAVREAMRKDPVTIGPDASTLDALEKMRVHGVGCLPVVRDGLLVGIVTEHDFMEVAGRLLEESLREND
ncbi:MAG: CBS domain-containing protein/gamma-glutamyl:cysteine ligase YbdK (ATP-grasp superfamily) [Chlamydiales bacterium]|jgi:CBS domain-containing protein/gamma-glutamyl:cysteine ligase YbdK (ATP-grasp superfamily)